MYNTVDRAIVAVLVLRNFRWWLVGRCVRDFYDRLGYMMETRAHDASSYRTKYIYSSAGVILGYWLHRLRMFNF